jgi:predicted  nucleic acid-binding Zn-ribbon protein
MMTQEQKAIKTVEKLCIKINKIEEQIFNIRADLNYLQKEINRIKPRLSKVLKKLL